MTLIMAEHGVRLIYYGNILKCQEIDSFQFRKCILIHAKHKQAKWFLLVATYLHVYVYECLNVVRTL